MEKYFEKAVEKLEKELKETQKGVKSGVIIGPTKNALIEFCRQEDEFAQAIVESDKTLGQCCEEILKDCGNAISDFDVYSKAVKFYFPGADVKFSMKIDLCASVGGNSLEVSLMDLI